MFDHDKYFKNLDLIVKCGHDEFKRIAIDYQKMQLDFLRAYMWSISILTAAIIKLYIDIKNNSSSLIEYHGNPSIFVHGCFIFSIIISVCCFIVCVDSLRGRNKATLPFGNLMSLATISYESASRQGDTTLMTTIINSLNDSICYETNNRHKIGLKLRAMSIALTLSLLLASLGYTLLVVNQ